MTRGLLFWLLLLFTCLVSLTPVWSADVYWHVRSGELIWELGAVHRLDPFAYGDPTREWIDLWWLFELMLAGVYGGAGAEGLSLVKAVLLTLAVGIGWRATGEELPPTGRVACWLPAVVVLSSRALIRPEILTYVYLALWLLVLENAERRPRWLWWLPASLVLWVNSQGLFVLGPILWCIYLGDRLLCGGWGGRWGLSPSPERPSPRALAVTSGLIVAACFANPYGLDGVLLPFEEFTMLGWNVGEFRSPFTILAARDTGAAYAAVALVFWLATVASFAGLARQGRLSPWRLLVFAAFSYLAADAYRNLGLFAIVSGVILCGNVGEWVARRPAGATEMPGRGPARSVWNLAAAALLMLLCLGVVTDQWHRVWSGGYLRFGLGESPDHYSHAAVRFAGRPGMPEHAYLADLRDAGAYILHNAPERRVYLYSRGEGARERWRNHYGVLGQMAKGDLRWVDAVRDPQVGLPAVIVPLAYRPVIAGLSRTPGWRLVHVSRAVVFVEEAVAERLGLRDHQQGER